MVLLTLFRNTICLTDTELGDRDFVLAHYQDYLSSYSGSQAALAAQADVELAARQLEVFGTNDIGTTVAMMAADPSLVSDGAWGFAHAGVALLAMQGVTNPVAEAAYQIAYYYTREQKARCDQALVSDVRDPITWTEDQRLDYYTVLVYTQWALS